MANDTVGSSHWIDAIGRNFERMLRWVYHGGLLYFLLVLNGKITFIIEVFPEQLLPKQNGIAWALLIFFLFSGAAVYIFQAYVVNMIIWIIAVRKHWPINANGEIKSKLLLKIEPHFRQSAKTTLARFGKPDKKLDDY